MILGIGVDILSTARFEAFVLRRGVERVARRICCDRELADFQRRFPLAPQADLSSLRYLSTRWVWRFVPPPIPLVQVST